MKRNFDKIKKHELEKELDDAVNIVMNMVERDYKMSKNIYTTIRLVAIIAGAIITYFLWL